ncbi:MAG: hypothetical protein J1E62_12240 [Lachnospiraceae bacterium]|nr:hypothetical protein [Lachnospiraceae bacterium]
MKQFDKEIKKRAKDFQVPDTYNKKVDAILETIQQDNVSAPKKKTFVNVAIVIAMFCVIVTGYFLFSTARKVEASFLDSFKQTILDFFGMDREESEKLGVKSEKEDAVSKPDLMMELQEVVMDSQNIYAVIKITAPADIEFNESMTFDYFGFCEGSNYNAENAVTGVRDCILLETLKGKPNVATYVLNISTDKQVKEGKEVTAFFKDLIAEPYDSTPDILVEGMWNLTFTASYTSTENITVKGTEDMTYSMLGETISIKKVKLLPLGMTVIMDVSEIPIDILHTSDTRVTVRLKMMDGSEVLVDSPEEGVKIFTDASSVSEYEKKGRVLNKYVCQFPKAIDINQVMGVYIEDCYVSLKEYE